MPSSTTFSLSRNQPSREHPTHERLSAEQLRQLAALIKQWGRELGFQQVGITDTDLNDHESHLTNWLDKGYHGQVGHIIFHLRPSCLIIILGPV